jgi:protein-tyrosine phosphatase
MITHDIRLIVNCTKDLPNYFESSDISYYRIGVDDLATPDNVSIMTMNIIPVMNVILDAVKLRRGVLIHCVAGVSRSATVCAALIRHLLTDTVDMAIDHMIKIHPVSFNGILRTVRFKKSLLDIYGN